MDARGAERRLSLWDWHGSTWGQNSNPCCVAISQAFSTGMNLDIGS